MNIGHANIRHAALTLIAAGPSTNRVLAARPDPKFSSLAKELVFMGGSFNPRPSNNAQTFTDIFPH